MRDFHVRDFPKRKKTLDRPQPRDAWDGILEQTMATCHPDRRRSRVDGGLCLDCTLDIKAKAHGVARIDATTPRRIHGVVQHTMTAMPDECPTCHGAVWREGRLIECRMCGSTWFLVVKEDV